MTTQEILANEATQRLAWEATTIGHKGYTIAALREAFDAVCDPDDWKAPLCASVRGEAVMVAVAAIEFYVGETPKVSLNTNTMRYLVESQGYRNGPAGDH